MRKMFDAVDAPTKKKKTKVGEDDTDSFIGVCRNVAEADQTKAACQNQELGKAEGADTTMVYHATEDYFKQGLAVTPSRAVTPPHSRSMHSSSQDNSPEVAMKIGDVVAAMGHMSAPDRGYNSHMQ